MADPAASEQEPAPDHPIEQHDEEHAHDLRGSFMMVMLMAGFFVLTWLGVFLVALERR